MDFGESGRVIFDIGRFMAVLGRSVRVARGSIFVLSKMLDSSPRLPMLRRLEVETAEGGRDIFLIVIPLEITQFNVPIN